MLNLVGGRHHLHRDAANEAAAALLSNLKTQQSVLDSAYGRVNDFDDNQQNMLATRGTAATQFATAGAMPTPNMAQADQRLGLQAQNVDIQGKMAGVEALDSAATIAAGQDAKQRELASKGAESDFKYNVFSDPGSVAERLSPPGEAQFYMNLLGLPTVLGDGEAFSPLIGTTNPTTGGFTAGPETTRTVNRRLQEGLAESADIIKDLASVVNPQIITYKQSGKTYDETVNLLMNSVGSQIMENLMQQQNLPMDTAAITAKRMLESAAAMEYYPNVRSWGG